MTIQELELELATQKHINAMQKAQFDELLNRISRVFMQYNIFQEKLGEPHYLTQEDLHALKNRGAEGLFRWMWKELRRVDKNGKKKYNFDLPTKP